MKSLLLSIILATLSLCARAEPPMEMHRVQATTQDPAGSGWYLAESSEGSFSVLVPLPFNDFTVIADDPKAGKIRAHIVGGKSTEGIKFSATEMPIIDPKTAADFASIPEEMRKSGQTVTDVDPAPFAGRPSVSFSVKGPATGAYIRYVKTPKSLITLILEYPTALAKDAEKFQAPFLSSLKLDKKEQAEAAKAGEPAPAK